MQATLTTTFATDGLTCRWRWKALHRWLWIPNNTACSGESVIKDPLVLWQASSWVGWRRYGFMGKVSSATTTWLTFPNSGAPGSSAGGGTMRDQSCRALARAEYEKIPPLLLFPWLPTSIKFCLLHIIIETRQTASVINTETFSQGPSVPSFDGFLT